MAVKLSLNSKLRFIVSLIALMFVIVLTLGFFVSTAIVENLKSMNADAELVSFSKRLGVMLFVAGGVGEFLTAIVYLILSKRGTVNYKRIIDSLDTTDARLFNLKVLFPEEDELGDLGKHLNKLISTLQQFDRIKTEKLQVCRKEVQSLIELLDKPVAITDSEMKITFMNGKFKEEIATNKQVEGFKMSSLFEEADEVVDEVKSASKEKEFKDVKGTQSSGITKADVEIIPFRDSNGNIVEYMWIVRNEKKRRK